MKKDCEANNGCLSQAFLEKNQDLAINDKCHESKSPKSRDEEYELLELKALSIAASAPDDDRQTKTERKSSSKSKKERVPQSVVNRKISKLEGKRKAERRKEKLMERIA